MGGSATALFGLFSCISCGHSSLSEYIYIYNYRTERGLLHALLACCNTCTRLRGYIIDIILIFITTISLFSSLHHQYLHLTKKGMDNRSFKEFMGLEQNIIFWWLPFSLHTPLLEYWKEEEREGGQEGLNFGMGRRCAFAICIALEDYLYFFCLFICLLVCLKRNTHNKKNN